MIITPGSRWLLRVTLAPDEMPDAAACRLIGGDAEHDPLPGTNGTLAFAVPVGARAEDYELQVGDRRLRLPPATPRRFARPSPMQAELDALHLRTQLARAEARTSELEAELRRRDRAAAHARDSAARWQERYRELRREAARLALHVRSEDVTARPPTAPARRRGRRVLMGAGACVLAAAAVGGAAVGAGGDSSDPAPRTAAAPVAGSVGDIPARWVRLYRRAGSRYGLDWTYLAAVGAIESGHGRHRGPSAAGADGPAQFLAATWQRFGLDADGDAIADPRSPADAVNAMAAYLRASGAPQDWTRALWTYNHSAAYARRVLRRAAQYRRLARRR